MVKSELLSLQNVGKATLHDLTVLGITHLAQLASSDPDELFLRLEQLTNKNRTDVFGMYLLPLSIKLNQLKKCLGGNSHPFAS